MENMKRYNSTWIIVLLILIILGLAGYICYDKYWNTNNSSEEKIIEDNENNGLNDKTESKYTIPEVEVPEYFCGGVDFPLKEGTIEVKSLDLDTKLSMLETVYIQLIPEEFAKGEYYGSAYGEDEIDNSYLLPFDLLDIASKYFEVTPELEKKVKDGFIGSQYYFKYVNNNSYVSTVVQGCIGGDGETGDYLVFKSKKTEGNILIKSYYYYYQRVSTDPVEVNGVSYFPVSIYKNKKDKDPYKYNIISKDNLDLTNFDTYDFYYDTSNGNMKFIKAVYNKH